MNLIISILSIIIIFNIYYGDAFTIQILKIGRCLISNYNKRQVCSNINTYQHHHLNSRKENEIDGWEYKRYSSDFIVLEDRVLEYLGEYSNDSMTKSINMNKKVEITLSNDELLTQLQSIITEQQLSDIELLSNDINPERTNLYMYFDYEINKTQRTTIHKSIKSLYPNLESKTETSVNIQSNNNSCIFVYKKGIRSVVIEDTSEDITLKASSEVDLRDDGEDKKDAKPKKNKRKVLPARWQSDKPEYYHFTVIKNGYNNADMLSYIARKISLLPSRLGYCGSKDKHAISLQRVSAWRVDKEVLEKINNIKQHTDADIDKIDKKNILIRDITVENTPLTTGDLLGNHFIVTLRSTFKPLSTSLATSPSLSSVLNHDNLITMNEMHRNDSYTSSHLYNNTIQAIQLLSDQSFPNYFGPQRFGSPLPTNPLVGELLIKGDYQRAVFVILLAPYNDIETELMNSSIDSLRYLLDCSNDPNEINVVNKLDINVLISRWDQYVLNLPQKIESLLQAIDLTTNASDTNISSYLDNNIEQQSSLDNDNLINKQQLQPDDVNDNEDYKENINESNDEEAISLEDDDDIISKNDIQNNHKTSKDRYYLSSILTKIKLIARLLHGELLPIYEIKLLLKLSGGQLQKILWKDLTIKLENYYKNNNIVINKNNKINNNDRNIGYIEIMVNENIINNDINYISKLDYAAIFGKLQKSLKLLFINSYQSLLWNNCVNNRLENVNNNIPNINVNNIPNVNVNNLSVMEGDLILVDYHKNPLSIWSLTEKKYTSTNADRVSRWRDNVKEITSDQHQEYKLYYHIVTKEEAELQIYPIQAMILPLPGRSTYIPSYMQNKIIQDSTELLINNSMDNSKSSSIFQVPGAYRHVYANAKNVRYQDLNKNKSNNWKEVEIISKSIRNNNLNFDNQLNNNIKDSLIDNNTKNNTNHRTFSNEVHRKWTNGIIPTFLEDIYQHINLIPTLGLPPSLIDPIYIVNNNMSSNNNNNYNSSSCCNDENIIRIAFSLGTSSYATTYLNWLLQQKLIN